MAKAERWQEVERRLDYHPPHVWRIEKRNYKLPDGKIGDYYIQTANATVCVLALTTDSKIVTFPEYRPGPDAIFRELPGGGMEDGEEAVPAGMRELLEETGYSGDVEWSAGFFEQAYSEVVRNVVVVVNCRKVGDQQLDSREFGDPELVEVADFVADVRAGRLTDTAAALLALDHLGLL